MREWKQKCLRTWRKAGKKTEIRKPVVLGGVMSQKLDEHYYRNWQIGRTCLKWEVFMSAPGVLPKPARTCLLSWWMIPNKKYSVLTWKRPWNKISEEIRKGMAEYKNASLIIQKNLLSTVFHSRTNTHEICY